MAKDFPADKYNFRLKPEMRSFGEVIVHIASGNVYSGESRTGREGQMGRTRREELPGESRDRGFDGENHCRFYGGAEGESGGMAEVAGAISIRHQSTPVEHYDLWVAN